MVLGTFKYTITFKLSLVGLIDPDFIYTLLDNNGEYIISFLAMLSFSSSGIIQWPGLSHFIENWLAENFCLILISLPRPFILPWN